MASIGIIRNTKEVIDATPIVDGQILITIDKGDDNKVYMDYGSQRITIGNGRPIDGVLNAESDNPISNKAVAGVMLQTMEQIQAVTQSGFLADAKAIKELAESVTNLSSGVEISWEDYQALSDEEKNSGAVYFIKDYQSGLYTAGREVTRAEYDALTKEQQNNGTLWLITDDTNGISALGVDYDNSKSGTKSATVQGALDDVNGRLTQSIDSIQSQIVPTASIEKGETASKAYSVGDFLVKNGALYKVTNAIVKDDVLTVETNIELDTVASELSSISERLSQIPQIVPMFNNAGAHNAIYRGKNLGTSVTTAQYNAIKAGTFDNLYIGDYWVINGVTWRIAAFDYYLRCGDSDLTTHHAVIVPDSSLYNHVMNDTNTTDGGYVGSKMYKEGLEQAKTIIKAAFSGHVLSHRIYLTNAVANGKPSAGAWCDSEVDLMCEEMVYGGGIFRPTSDGSTVPLNYRVEKSQLPLFAHRPDLISRRITYWLRDVVTAALFALVDGYGNAGYFYASASRGVRPAFCIS